MQHFLDIEQLSAEAIQTMIAQARSFEENPYASQLPYHAVALMFYENSTRTRISFEKAAKQLSMQVIHVDISRSSESKGEAIEDTIRNLAAMGIHHFIIRHSQDGLPVELSKKLSTLPVHIINGGDGKRAHPSQALLDMMTVLSYKPKLSDIKITVVGNLRHSRVARSFTTICEKMGVGELVFVSPKIWAPESMSYGQWTDDLSDGLKGADVVMGLRVQKERLASEDAFDINRYQQDFRIDAMRLALAKPDAIVMHPGPVNRGIEMTSDVIDGPQSKILEQVTNGVYVRMAILTALSKIA
jgi:aspartate carbamoyltransferase catalytic subunit